MIRRLQQFYVYGMVTEGNQILLVQKSKGPYKGLWDLPGGKIEFGESPDTTLIREMIEETGLELKEYKFLKTDALVTHYTDENQQKVSLHLVGFIFKVKLDMVKDIMPKQDDEELVITKWCSFDELDVNELTPFLQEILMEQE